MGIIKGSFKRSTKTVTPILIHIENDPKVCYNLSWKDMPEGRINLKPPNKVLGGTITMAVEDNLR